MGTGRRATVLVTTILALAWVAPTPSPACGGDRQLGDVRLLSAAPEAVLHGFVCRRAAGGACAPFSTASGDALLLVAEGNGRFRVDGDSLPCPAGDAPLVAYVLEGAPATRYAVLTGPSAEAVPLLPLRLAPRLRPAGRDEEGAWIVDVAPPAADVNCGTAPGERCRLGDVIEERITGLWLRGPEGATTSLSGCAGGCRGLRLPLEGEVCWSGELRLVRRDVARCSGGSVAGFPCAGAEAAAACTAVGGTCGSAAQAVGPPLPGACAPLATLRTAASPGFPASARHGPGNAAASRDASAPEVVVAGDCPGTLSIDVRSATPGARLALVVDGEAPAPEATCTGGGALLPPGSGLLSIRTADALGRLSVERTSAAGWCGRALRALDLGTCRAGPGSWLPGR